MRLKFARTVYRRDVNRSPGAYMQAIIAAKHNASIARGPIYFELNKRSRIFEIQGTFLRVRHENARKKQQQNVYNNNNKFIAMDVSLGIKTAVGVYTYTFGISRIK